jgi:hypothetical protein
MDGAFLIEAVISSYYQIAIFFGLTQRIKKPKEADTSVVDHPSIVLPRRLTRPATADRPEHRNQARSRGIDVGAVITKALTAAGLMK